MTRRPDPLLAALDAVHAPVTFFVRDDDAGWADDRLCALLDCAERAGVPIDLAAIPTAMTGRLAATLAMRMETSGGRIGVHQHGCAHLDHEAPGRKCEFGAARPLQAQRLDFLAGRERLQALFGARLDPLFTPPWNRCAEGTPALLAQLGYAALSRDVTAPRQDALPELPVHVDWCRQRRISLERGDSVVERVARELASHVPAGAPVGLMLHHAPMTDDELAALASAWSCWTRHPNARWRRMDEVLAERTAAGRIEETPT